MLYATLIVPRVVCRQAMLSVRSNTFQLLNTRFSACASYSIEHGNKKQFPSSLLKNGSHHTCSTQFESADNCRLYSTGEKPPVREYWDLKGFDDYPASPPGFEQVYQYANQSAANVIRIQKFKIVLLGFTGISYVSLFAFPPDLFMKVGVFYLTVLAFLNMSIGQILQKRILRIYVNDDTNEAMFVGVDFFGKRTSEVYKLHDIKSIRGRTPAQITLEVPQMEKNKPGNSYNLLMNMTNADERRVLNKYLRLGLKVQPQSTD